MERKANTLSSKGIPTPQNLKKDYSLHISTEISNSLLICGNCTILHHNLNSGEDLTLVLTNIVKLLRQYQYNVNLLMSYILNMISLEKR